MATSPPTAPPAPGVRIPWRPLAQLVRLPNVFTALADICLGALAVGALSAHWLPFVLLLLASASLYSAGMVWNDWFDVEQDKRERPFRPLPSGKISMRTAFLIGALLLALGLLFAWLADLMRVPPGWPWPSAIVSVVLVVAILLYDARLKRTWTGPIGMGVCRFLNVLLGLTTAGTLAWPWGWHLAFVVGLYIVGVTWFARTEASDSAVSHLKGAALVMGAAFLLALLVPAHAGENATSPLFPYLLVLAGFVVGLPVWKAIAKPSPQNVQRAVKRAIMGLVLLDALLATALAGTVGLVILILLLPALYLGRWIYST